MSGHAETGAGDTADVLIYVQHLLGIGHLHRAAVIAKALDRAGLEVVLASGGARVEGLDPGRARFVQLPPVRAFDQTFAVLVDAQDRPIDAAWKAARAEQLCALYRACRPKALLIELFPFGRRQMRFELLPLLEAARAGRPRPQILCSLRDVLTDRKNPEKTAWMLDTFVRFFDLALVHGDPGFLPLERSFPQARRIADKLRYTGYVVADPPAPGPGERTGEGEVIVSTGGGAVAEPLVEAALAARPHTPLKEAAWRTPRAAIPARPRRAILVPPRRVIRARRKAATLAPPRAAIPARPRRVIPAPPRRVIRARRKAAILALPRRAIPAPPRRVIRARPRPATRAAPVVVARRSPTPKRDRSTTA